MKKCRLITASSDSADMLYASKFNAPDPFVYYAIGRDKGLIVSTLEYSRAQSETPAGIQVVNRDQFLSPDEKAVQMTELLLRLSRRNGVTAWEVPGDFPVKYADSLRAEGVEIKPAEGEFFPKREVKTQKEIDCIKEAMKVTENGMYRALDIIKQASVDSHDNLVWNGQVVTSEFIRSEIEVEALRGGGNAFGTIVACGPQGAQPHNHGSGPLKAGQSIIIDIFPRMQKTGYWGDLTRTVVKGKAPEVVRKAFEAVKTARDQSKKYVKAGVKGKKSYELALQILDEAGFPTGRKNDVDFGFIHGLGHGVGLEIHEFPRLSPASESLLKKGSVVTVEPGVYYPKWGGVRLEDMVVVQDYKCQTLTTIDTVLEIA